MSTAFLYWSGLLGLSKSMKGNERVLIGIRPFGFHAGNMLAVLAYPLHLCKNLVEQGKKPRLHFFISINDMEPSSLNYLTVENGEYVYKSTKEMFSKKRKTKNKSLKEYKYQYNIFPKSTSFQFTKDLDTGKSVVDIWENKIKEQMKIIQKQYTSVKVTLVRNSSLKPKKVFRKVIDTMLTKPMVLGKILKENAKTDLVENKLYFTGLICPHCKSAIGKSSINKNKYNFVCNSCGITSTNSYKNSNFWLHHVPLMVPRMALLKPQLIIRGGDHYNANRVKINEVLCKNFFDFDWKLKTLVTPVVVDEVNRKMSKGWGNTINANIESVLDASLNYDEQILPIARIMKRELN
ncbi:MAG: hypothetical protein PHD05_00960 [Sphaerochaetaceae bacterium]|nr:hypothetical protein [Sphaerochaetaceae bacterium]